MNGSDLKQLEDKEWEAAYQLWANSKLTATEYSFPVLGLIFLRHASFGMAVQAGHFLEDQREKITFYGQEKADTNTKLARITINNYLRALSSLNWILFKPNTHIFS